MPQPTPREVSSASAPLLVCHSHLRWDWVYQRPQHVLTRLAEHGPVLVEEEPEFDDRPPGLDILSVAPGVTVMRPHRRRDEDHDIAGLVEDYIRAVRGARPLVRWFYSAMFAPYGDRLGSGQTVVYDCMDELANFAHSPAGLVEAERRLLERADVVFTGGRSLFESKQGENPNVHCFPSAVDYAHFAAAVDDPTLTVPADLAALPGPIYGYYGVVDERLDYAAIAQLAVAVAGAGSVVLVGPMIKVDVASLPQAANLHYLGQRSYADLPAYLKGFDVCLMPWALNDATKTISPTKTLEYMAAGKPIVSTRVRDVVRDHGDLVFLADDAADFVQLAQVAAARFAGDSSLAERERQRARDHGWDATAAAMLALIPTPPPAEASPPGDLALSVSTPTRSPRHQDAKNLVIGGGPAGLSAAFHLEDADFILAEKNSRTGGLCRSIIDGGFTFDYAGHIFFTTDKYVDGLFRSVLADNFHEQHRESWVYLYGDYQRYPFQGNLYGLPPAVVKECLLGVIEANRLHPAAGLDGDAKLAAPANFLEWSYRTFGAGITDHFMRPYNRKVWGIDPERMSSDWIEGRVLTPTLDEVIEGALTRGRPDMGPNARFGYPLHGGCETFVAGLADRVRARGGAITTSRTLVKLDPSRKRATFRIEEPGAQPSDSPRYETIGYDTLYPSVPLPDLIAAIDGVPDAVRRAATSLPSTAVVCVNLGINREKVTEKHWIYYPEGQDKYIFQRIFVQSNASPFNAPPGHSALTFEISHSDAKPLPVRGKRALVDACVAGLKQTDLWQDGDEVVFEQVLGMPHAYIPFTPERPGQLAVINEYLHGHGIFPVGRFGEWKYLNQDGAILSSKRVVESVQATGRIEPARAAQIVSNVPTGSNPKSGSNGTHRPVASV